MKKMGKRFWDRLVGFLKAGSSPEQLALTCALGVIIGILPIWGITTILCFIIAAIFRLNIVVMQLAHYFVYPLQLILIIPFIKLGTFLFNVNPMPYALNELTERFSADFWGELQQVGLAIALGVSVWAIASVPLFAVVYFTLRYLFAKWRKVNVKEVPIR